MNNLLSLHKFFGFAYQGNIKLAFLESLRHYPWIAKFVLIFLTQKVVHHVLRYADSDGKFPLAFLGVVDAIVTVTAIIGLLIVPCSLVLTNLRLPHVGFVEIKHDVLHLLAAAL